ncbi:cell wall hydrolase [Neobacillus sedimentimangrovi]|uniref:cell wall hydrolase n=1 Tax=Neobacillus sedimentimangrovi TaxID=2699460 RepID=UPI0013D84AE1|nr:cell wall hydrolase [Neobacillus sedimentimangrovi]
MKNSMKVFVVACVATVGFVIHNSTARAIDEYIAKKEDLLTKINQEKDSTVKNIDINKEKNQDEVQVSMDEILKDPELLTDSEESNKQDDSKVEEKMTKPTESETVTKAEVAPSEPSNQEEKPVQTMAQTEPEVKAEEEKAEAPKISLSEKEKDLFARLVEAEAKGEPYEGKVAVATVVLNRVESPEFPDTVTEVIHEKVGDAYAFTPVQNGEINKPASEEAIKAVEEALKREDTLNNSIYFYNPEIATDNWIRTRQTVKTIGNHVFAK